MLAEEMPWPEEQQAKSNPPAQPRNPAGRPHRGRRGGRGRNPRQTAKAVVTGQIASPVLGKKETQTTEPAAVAINKAVDEVRQIVESLEQALQQMEEVLRLVEVAERQKITDEHEIESLRRALRKIQQPRSRQPERPQPDS
jgi:exonuclease VII small subunit